MRRDWIVFFASWLVFNVFSIGAEVPANLKNIKFQHLSVENGLSQSYINDIIQDSDGFMWFATNDGLNRFDGRRFKIYRNLKASDGIARSKITVVYEDSYKNIWVGTFGGGLFLYDKKFDKWTNYFHNPADPASLSDNNISKIAENENGLWIATFNGGLQLFSYKTGNFKKFEKTDESIYSFLLQPKDELLYGTAEGISWFSYPKNESKRIPILDNEKPVRIKSPARVIYKDGLGNIWAGFEKEGLYVMRYGDSVFRKFIYPDGEFHDYSVRAIMEDNQRNLWIGYDGEGVGIYNLADKHFISLKNDENDPSSLSNNTVYALYQSKDGVVWLGNYGSGINIFDRKKYKFQHYKHIQNNANSLINNNVRTIFEDRQQKIWIGTRNGLDLFDPEALRFKHYLHDPRNPNSLSYDIVLDIYEDSKSRFWIATFSGGLNLLNRETGSWKVYRNIPGDQSSLNDDRVYKIFEDSYHILWIGTLSGLNELTDKNQFISYKGIAGIKEIFEDSKQRILIGADRGFFLFDRKTKAFSKIGPSEITSQVFCIHETPQKEFFVGTEGSGILVFDENLNFLHDITEEEGLPNNIVYGILQDDRGYLWISTNKGLTRYSGTDKTFLYYDESDGLQGYEYNSGSYLKDSKGRFYFGGTNGLNIFKPGDIEINTYIPKVVISAIRLYNKEIPVGEKNSPLKVSILYTKQITLRHDETTMSLEFASLSFTNPQRNHFTYTLDGFDDTWNDLGTNNQINLTHIPPGKYSLKVKGSNNDLIWNPEPVLLDIIVKPPFYKSWLAILVYLGLVVFLLILFKKYSLIGVHEKNRPLIEKLESRKKEELNQLKLSFFTNISHEFRTPLTLIMGPIHRLIETHGNDPVLKENLLLMEKNSKKLLNLVNQVMDFRRVEQERYDIKLIRMDFIGYARDVVGNFHQLSIEKRIKLSFFSEIDELFCWFAPDVIDKVFYNLLSNAFKNTGEDGEISVYINRNKAEKSKRRILFKNANIPEFEEYFQIVFKDTGAGIEKSKLGKIFDRFYQIDNISSLRSEGSGIGLAFSKSLMKLHFGDIDVESEKGKGSRFYVKFPIIAQKLHLPNHTIIFVDEPSQENILTNVKNYIWQGETKFTEVLPEDSKEGDAVQKEEVLVVDDDKDIVRYIRNLLSDQYKVHCAFDGEEAFKLATEIIPDVIIADVMMPKMDGIEFCKAIKSHQSASHIPIILLTAKTSLEYKVESFAIGADDYITKPFEPELLRVRIRNLIQAQEKLKERFNKRFSLEPSQELVPSADELFFQKLIQLVEKNMSNPEFSIDEIVDQIGMSRAVLYRKIKALTGQTVNDLVKTIRLKKAAILLATKKYSISEVAYNTGFNDPKYFAKCFKKEYNLSPREYINQAE